MFKSFAVHGVKTLMLNGQKHVEECPDTEAECFGLYGYEADGTCRWLADYPTRHAAEAARNKKEMRFYTVQVWISGYSAPEGDDVEHFTSLQAIRNYLCNTITEAEGYGAAYGDEGNGALIYRGLIDDVTDQYPDLRAYVGPRGGIRFE